MQLHGHNRFAGSAGCIKVYIFLLMPGALIIHDPLPNLSAGICASVFYLVCRLHLKK